MPFLHAVVLGLLQGLTEFFPVSSSGHLAVVPWILGWNDFADPGLKRSFDVALHLGTFLGALVYLRAEVWSLGRSTVTLLVRRHAESDDERMAGLLAVATLPAVVGGALLDQALGGRVGPIWLVGALMLVFGLLLGAADRLPARRFMDHFSWKDALAMGAAQALALQPGVSRSGVTISVARWAGFDRDSAVRLSFLMSLPVIIGAGLYEGVGIFADGGLPSSLIPPFLVGVATSAVSGFVAVWATLRLVRTRSLRPFVVYRAAFGVLVIAFAALGVAQ